MGSSSSTVNFEREGVEEGKVRICVAGFKMCPHTGSALKLANLIASKYPDIYSVWYYFDWSRSNYYTFIGYSFVSVEFPDHLKGHDTSPFVWLESNGYQIDLIGGRSNLCEWSIQKFPEDEEIREVANSFSCRDFFY